jgi:hypothetical protein
MSLREALANRLVEAYETVAWQTVSDRPAERESFLAMADEAIRLAPEDWKALRETRGG